MNGERSRVRKTREWADSLFLFQLLDKKQGRGLVIECYNWVITRYFDKFLVN